MASLRIHSNIRICGGKPCLRSLRFPVARLVGLVASGQSRQEILENYPYLQEEDVEEALVFAARLTNEQKVP